MNNISIQKTVKTAVTSGNNTTCSRIDHKLETEKHTNVNYKVTIKHKSVKINNSEPKRHLIVA